MAKQRKRPEEREITRKETARRRRDAEQNRRVWIGLIGVGALLLLLIGAGALQELVFKPRQPVATVNGVGIASRAYAHRVSFSWLQSGQEVTDPEGSSLQVLDQMIDEQLLREQARQRGITVSADEIDQVIEKNFGYLRVPPTAAPTPTPAPSAVASPTGAATPGGTETATPVPTPVPPPTSVSQTDYQKAYKDYITRLNTVTGMSEAESRALVEMDLLRQKLYAEVTKDAPTAEEQVHARHILVAIRTPAPTPTPLPTDQPTPTPNPSATPPPEPRDEAQALARITEIQQKLNAGEDFAALAKEYSDDTYSGKDGGDLGWFGRGMMVQEFEEVAFSLEPGKISEPVKTQFGYHLIQVIEKDPARALDQYTLQQRKYEFYNQWLTTLRQGAKIERYWSVDKVPPTPAAPQQ
jgi:parvulin-like peptidyl-prolyl isomerase